MSNGVYEEVKRMVLDPKVSAEEKDRCLIALWLDMHQMIQGVEGDVKRNTAYVSLAKQYPSVHQRFVQSPVKTTLFVVVVFTVLDLIANLVPEFLKYLLALL